jgi:hypothetical protein
VTIGYHLMLLAIYAGGVWLLVIPAADRAGALLLLRERLLIRRAVSVAATGAD